jgi:tripeptidyl-peptidase-1
MEAFAPADETVDTVLEWLTTAGIHRDRITHSDNKGWLAFAASAEELEGILHTEYYEYEDMNTGDKAVATLRYDSELFICIKTVLIIILGIMFPTLSEDTLTTSHQAFIFLCLERKPSATVALRNEAQEQDMGK